jgi:hypothetical protein
LITAEEEPKRYLAGLLAKFSHDFDTLVETIRSEWIQVRRRDEEKGLFDFRILESDYRVIATSLAPNTSFEQFVDLLLIWLMQRLETGLTIVRQYVSSNAKADLDGLLVELLASVQKLGGYVETTELENAIKGARTDLSHAVNRIVEWFQLPKEESSKPFALSFAITIAQESVKRVYRYDEMRPTVEIKEDLLLPNLLLPRVVSLFGNIFDNIARHARTVGAPRIVIRSESAGDEIRVVVENEVGPDVFGDAERERMLRIQSELQQGAYRGSLSREGGSGLHKIHKILTRDLGGAGDLQFGFRDAKTFFVEIALSKELRAV